LITDKQFISPLPSVSSSGKRLFGEAFGANIFKEDDELQFEKDHGVNAGTTSTSIGLVDELSDEREIECSL